MMFGSNMVEAEWTAVKRKMHPKNWRANSAAAYAVVACIYMFMFYIVIQAAGSIEPTYLFFPMMFFTLLVLPVVLHGSISGERQSRSLESLYAAPVSPGEILLAKATRAIPALLGIIVSCGFLMLLVGVVRAFQPPMFSADTRTGFLIFLFGFVGVFALAFLVTGITMWISAVSKSTGSALLGTVGAMIGLFLIVPIVVATLIGLISPEFLENVIGIHPMGFVGVLLFNQDSFDGSGAAERDVIAGVGVLIWFLIGAVFWGMAVSKLNRERSSGVVES